MAQIKGKFLVDGAITTAKIADGNVTAAKLAQTYIQTSEKGVNSGVATLDAGGKIPSSQIPAIAITEVFTVADIAARDALTVGDGAGEIQEGDVVIVTDASDDAAITAGAAAYIYDGSAYKLLKAGDEVLSVNGETGVVSLSSADLNNTQADTDNWTVADESSIKAHLDEAASRLVALETDSHTHANKAILDATTASFVTADEAKLDFITVTQAVDLDTMESGISDNATAISDHLADAADAHDASAISFVNTTSGLTATDVQAAIEEVEGRVDTLEGASVAAPAEEVLTLIADDITDQYVDLAAAAASAASISLTPVGGPMQLKGTDYTVSLTGGAGGVTRITFAGDLATGGDAALVAGDKLIIRYEA